MQKMFSLHDRPVRNPLCFSLSLFSSSMRSQSILPYNLLITLVTEMPLELEQSSLLLFCVLMKCKQLSIVAELLHLSIYLLPMSTLLSVYLFHVLAFQHKLLLIHMTSHFSFLSLPFLLFLHLLLLFLRPSV